MNPLEFLNENPALTSIIAFPLGVLMLLGVARLMRLGSIYTETLQALRDHTAAELKIEERITDVVSKMSDLINSNTDTRQHFDVYVERVVNKVDNLQRDVTIIITSMRKRKSDFINYQRKDPNGESGTVT